MSRGPTLIPTPQEATLAGYVPINSDQSAQFHYWITDFIDLEHAE